MTSQEKVVLKISSTSDSDPIRRHSNPTLEQVIAQQKLQASQHPQPILPRLAPERTTQIIPASRKTAMGRRKRSPDDTRPRPNRCPLPGTEEAKYRTLMASIARCKSDEKKRELLQKRGITEEEFKNIALKPKKPCRSAENKGSIGQTPVHSPPQWGTERYHHIMLTCDSCLSSKMYCLSNGSTSQEKPKGMMGFDGTETRCNSR